MEAIEFWKLNGDLPNHSEYSGYWFDDVWKSKMAGGGGNKKRCQYCTSGREFLYIRALQGHSRRNPIDPTLRDNVLNPDDFFEYIYHVGCAVSLHSITNSGLIAGGQNSSSERQTVFFTAVNPMNKNHKNPQELDLTKPRLASYKHKWKRLHGTVRISCNIYRTRIISITSDGSKGHGYHVQTARVRRTSSGRCICSNPGQNGRCFKIIEHSRIGMSRHLDSTTTQMVTIMVQFGRLTRSSWMKSVWSSLSMTDMGKAIWENPIETWMGENFQLGRLVRTPQKRMILISVCGWHQIGWKETKF